MNGLRRIREHPNYGTLKNSVQYRHDRKNLIIILAFALGTWVFLALMLLSIVLEFPKDGETVAKLLGAMALVGLIWLPFVVYYVYRWLGIFLHIDSYVFCETLLDKPHSAGRNGMYFTVRLTDPSGQSFTRETSRMFSSVSEPVFEEYLNRKALVGYNGETDRVVILRRVG